MATVPFSKLTGKTLGEALRKAIREDREAEQLESARSRGLQLVTETRTGRRGWVVQQQNYGFHYRVRWAGGQGEAAVSRVRVDDIEFDEN